MGDFEHHRRLAAEKRAGALAEYRAGRYTNVGDLALKAAEQGIEAAAAKLQDQHFHIHPRAAHAERQTWAKMTFPELAAAVDTVWSAYGDLGYDGLDGRRAKAAIEAMESILDGIARHTGIRFQ